MKEDEIRSEQLRVEYMIDRIEELKSRKFAIHTTQRHAGNRGLGLVWHVDERRKKWWRKSENETENTASLTIFSRRRITQKKEKARRQKATRYRWQGRQHGTNRLEMHTEEERQERKRGKRQGKGENVNNKQQAQNGIQTKLWVNTDKV